MTHPLLAMQSARCQSLSGTVLAPGDKSLSHRALMLSSQALGKTTIEGMLEGEDVISTAEALRALGVRVDRQGPGAWQVQGVGPGGLQEPADILNMGNSGTSTRLLMGLLAPYGFTSFFTGDASLRGRPMKRVSAPLEMMGARFVTRSGGRLPAAMIGTNSPMPIDYTLPVASAQVKSAILLAALNTAGTTRVTEPHPTRDHTERMLRHLGWKLEIDEVEGGGRRVTLAGHQNLAPAERSLSIPADPSSAAFAVVAALIVPGSDIIVPHVCVNTLRTGLYTTLQRMGAQITFSRQRVSAGEEVADIHVRHSALRAVEVPGGIAPSMIDEYPILAVAAAFAEGTTVMHGLGELRVKESDRFNAIIEGLGVNGVKAEAEGDTLRVTGMRLPPGGGLVRTKLDHRIAMSFLVLGMQSQQPVQVDDGSAINTSFPGFMELMNKAGARITASAAAAKGGKRCFVVAIDGPAASGKGTLARRLAEQLGFAYLDTGSLYRAVGLKLIYSDRNPYDKRSAIEAAMSLTEHDLSNPRLRQERVGKAASVISAIPEVRSVLLDYQRQYGRSQRGVVLDGRDIGTVVCPDADIKFFITASFETRAKRRHRELQGEGIEVIYESVLDDLRERDERDAQRAVAPLVAAKDAHVIDTSHLDAAAVYQKALDLTQQKLRAEPLAKP